MEDDAESAAAVADVARDAKQDVDCVKMQDEVEERDATEYDERIAVRESESVIPGEQH